MATRACARITVLPLGEIAPALLHQASQALHEAYGLPVEIAERRAPNFETYDAARKQYRASELLDAIASLRAADTCLVGVVPADVYGPSTNFLFGLGSSRQRTAIVATARFSIDGDPERVAERSAKAVVHEVGHAIGLGHCDVSGCVMRYSNDLPSFDRKTVRFCERHRLEADGLVALADR
jgi:archaemetzincin